MLGSMETTQSPSTLRQSIKAYAEFLAQQRKGFVYSDENSMLHKMLPKSTLLATLNTGCANCTACPLAHSGRKQVVFGQGNPDARLMLLAKGQGEMKMSRADHLSVDPASC